MKIALGIRLGKAEQRALRFICKVDGWTTYSSDAKREIISLQKKGLVDLFLARQKYCATKEGKAIFPEGVNVAQMTIQEIHAEYDSIIDLFRDYYGDCDYYGILHDFNRPFDFQTMATIYPIHYERLKGLRAEFQRRKALGVV